jgi:riboflavin biosynthesis pyrimidine reductase
LVKTVKKTPLWIVGNEGAFLRGGIANEAVHIQCNGKNGLPRSHRSLADILSLLAEQNITRLMIEAGPTLSHAFMKSGLVDRLYAYSAPHILGEHAHPTLPTFNVGVYAAEHNLAQAHQERLGKDILRVYKKTS